METTRSYWNLRNFYLTVTIIVAPLIDEKKKRREIPTKRLEAFEQTAQIVLENSIELKLNRSDKLFFRLNIRLKSSESRNIYIMYRNSRGSPIDVRQRTGRTPRGTRPLFISARLLVRCIIRTFLDRVDRCCNYTSFSHRWIIQKREWNERVSFTQFIELLSWIVWSFLIN